MGGFIRGARQDPRYAQKQAKELESLPSSTILTQPVDLLKINIGSLQGWLCWRIQEVLGGVEDEILAGMIRNILEEEREKMSRIKGPAGSTRSWSPKELQHTLGPFLSEEVARSFMEELWILLLDAQTAPDGIPQAWGPAERSKFVGDDILVEPDQVIKKEKVMLGSSSSAQMRLRSPERVIGRLIEDAKEQSRPRERSRYFDAEREGERPRDQGDYGERPRDRDEYRDDYRERHHEDRHDDRRSDRHDDRRSDRHDDYRRRDRTVDDRREEARQPYRGRTRSRSRTRAHAKLPSPERTPSPVHRRQRDFSADTYSSDGSPSRKIETRSPVRHDAQSPVRQRSASRSSSRSASRSRSKSKRRHRHKKKHHKKKHHKKHRRSHSTSRSRSRSPSRSKSPSRTPSRSPSREDTDMSDLEKLLRRKALESVQQRSRD